jgi:hypothetical protein
MLMKKISAGKGIISIHVTMFKAIRRDYLKVYKELFGRTFPFWHSKISNILKATKLTEGSWQYLHICTEFAGY